MPSFSRKFNDMKSCYREASCLGNFGEIVERRQALSGCRFGDTRPLAPARQPGRGERAGAREWGAQSGGAAGALSGSAASERSSLAPPGREREVAAEPGGRPGPFKDTAGGTVNANRDSRWETPGLDPSPPDRLPPPESKRGCQVRGREPGAGDGPPGKGREHAPRGRWLRTNLTQEHSRRSRRLRKRANRLQEED